MTVVIVFYLTTVQRYDYYKLALIDPDNGCNIIDATWDAMKTEAINYGTALAILTSIRVAI